ncbi:MAG: transcriptional regulator [Alteromonas sp.]|nr:transcriptional regulator [Alteromonas sp.]
MRNKIKHFRREQGMTLASLADMIGWSAARLSNYENGIRQPSLNDCRLIVSNFKRLGCKVNLDDVFPPDEDKEAA